MPVMTPEWNAQREENQAKWFFGHKQATLFLDQLFTCVELWDDLIDGDADVTEDRVNTGFLTLFIGLPGNDWFIEHRAHYLPLMLTACNAFHDANALAGHPDKKMRNIAFHIRNLGIEIYIATAFLLGGFDHMRAVSPEIRAFFAFESFEEWEHA